MKQDLHKIQYLPDIIGEELLDRIAGAERYQWSISGSDIKVLDSKVIKATWITNESAKEPFSWYVELFDQTPYNVIEAEVNVWVATKKKLIANPDAITCYSYRDCYLKTDLLENGFSCGGLGYDGFNITEKNGTIYSTSLPEEGILALVEILEEELHDIDFDEFITYEYPDHLHPRIKEFHKKAYKKLLKEKKEFDAYLEGKEKEQKQIDLKLSSQHSSIVVNATFLSKYHAYYIDLELNYYGNEECDSLIISARPNQTYAKARLKPVWTKEISIKPVKLHSSIKYITSWSSKKENIALLKLLHQQASENT